jgi:hypothetical protein
VNTTTTDLAAQVAEQRDRLTEQVGTLADKIDTGELRARAESGAADLLDTVTDSDGKPKRGFLLGALAVVGLLILARKLLR